MWVCGCDCVGVIAWVKVGLCGCGSLDCTTVSVWVGVDVIVWVCGCDCVSVNGCECVGVIVWVNV